MHATMPGFTESARERIRALNADPEFAARRRERSSEQMRSMVKSPEFIAASQERWRKNGGALMKKLHQDPDFRERTKERLARAKDPVIKAKAIASVRDVLSKPCRCVSVDGAVTDFESVSQASIEMGIDRGSIAKWCRKRTANRRGMRWEYL